MDVDVCNGVTIIDLTDPCIRALWTSFLPSALVLGLLFVKFIVPTFPGPILRLFTWLSKPFHRYITLEEAEAIDLDAVKAGGGVIEGDVTTDRVRYFSEDPRDTAIPLWRTLIFTIVGLLESLGWLTIASFRFVTDPHPTDGKEFWYEVLGPLGIALAWLYTAVRSIARPTATPPFDSFALYVLFLLGGIVKVGEMLYSHLILGVDWPSDWKVGLEVLDLTVVLALVIVVLVMPLAIPSSLVKKEQIGLEVSPENYTSLFGWITFSWVYPLVQRGRNTTLNEKDVWSLSPTVQSRPIFIKFSTLPQVTLLRKLWAANSLDLTLDFVLTFVSVTFNYMGPFFLKRILDLIDLKHPTPESRSRAYIYAFLAFICTLLKSEADVQHLWLGRRAATRMRSELMASIYDKALKRKDFSGITDKSKAEETKQKAEEAERDRREASEASTRTVDSKTKKKEEKEKKKRKEKEEKDKAAKADDPKAGADVGKIVNLMAGDANRISNMVSGAYFIYGAPFEIIIAGTFLYQLMGLSAFAGFFVLILGWPLNSFIARRSIRIQKGVLAARDKRMGVLNELIGAIKLIKFFAWEDRWIDRAMDARGYEMKWFIKARINSVMFYMLWTCAPILVSIISFFVYVQQGNELTISVAFTAIALFSMIRAPLNVIPAWIVQILQTGVALKRIAVYLDEDEVSPQVSSLKKGFSPPSTLPGWRDFEEEQQLESGLGIAHGSFKWNEVEEKKDGDDKGKGKDSTSKSTGHGKDASSSSSRTVAKHGVSPTRSTETGSTLSSPGDVETASTSTAARNAEDQEESESPTSPASSNGSEEQKFELKDLDVLFPEGELTVVTGPTASGKTALLMALLGEMTTLSGQIIMSKDPSKVDENGYMHAISYAAQSPWLRHQSIKDNILFGYPYEEDRYNETIECCALLPDLDMLEDGDQTEIGARGVSLSGGQKARVALARAIYARTKYVLLDDPLSAVDSHTARFLFDRLFRGPLLRNRTVVLVTHHVELVLPGAYYLVRMLDGRIDTKGAVKDLRAQGALDDIVHDAEADAAAETDIQVRVEDESGNEVAVAEGDKATSPSGDSPTTDSAGKKPRKLIKDEHRETGGVKWSIYKSYLRASSYWIWGFLGFMVVVNQFLGITEKLWIKTWGEAYGSEDLAPLYTFRSFATQEHGLGVDGYLTTHQLMHPHQSYNTNFRTDGLTYQSGLSASITGFLGISFDWPKAQEHPLFYVAVYAVIGFASAMAGVISVTAQYTGALRASRILFKKLLVTVVRATFRFHDTTPQGRLLNRFGKDIETIDTSLAGSLQAVNSSLASFFASILTVAIIFPGFLIPAVVIGFAYRELAIGYLNTGRDLRRMESNTRSPIFSDFGELLEGIVTVRAFSAERRFLDNLHKKIDLTTQMWYSFWMTNRWLLLNFDALGALGVLITTLFSIATLTDGAGFAGLCITSAMAFTTSVYWACRFWTGLELDLNSVERIVEYLDLPQEAPNHIEGRQVPAYWPSSANNESLISVENLTIKYAPDLPAVLQNVSFQLKAGERVGLLGRTGSGKSTLAMSILRFVDPVEGKIVIDGIDISNIGLYDLRSRLTFIPQDATLFSGTLKENLDPFGEHSEEDCLDVLRRVHMINQSTQASRVASRIHSPSSSRPPSRAESGHEVDREATAATTDTFYTAASSSTTPSISGTSDVDSKPLITLDSQVSAGGTNFSQGQRQLIAMARALLRRSSIIVLDEATSSIDFNTDAKIQQTIREEFTDSLLLTVAHRLRTVIDYDRLLVLDKGQVVEFDTPYNLIRKDNGIFRQMCLKSGTFNELVAAAQAKAERG